MILTPEEIKKQTRDLWRLCFHDSEDFMDIYFDEKYSDEVNLTLRPKGRVSAAVQVLPYRMTFYGLPLRAGYISGLCTHPDERGNGYAAQLMRDAHRHMYAEGTLLSFLIPGDDGLRKFYENSHHGAYWTSTYRSECVLTPEGDTFDKHIVVNQPESWGNDLYVFYRRHTMNQPFMLHPSENDFFAALETCDLGGGYVLVARRKQKVVGLCLAVVESDGRCCLRSLLALDAAVRDALLRYLYRETKCSEAFIRGCTPGSLKGAQPYAMARVVNVEKFLQTVLKVYPDFQMHIGVDGDTDIPENNGYYLMEHGKVVVTDLKPDSVVTPGGLAAMFLSSHPLMMEMMLDE